MFRLQTGVIPKADQRTSPSFIFRVFLIRTLISSPQKHTISLFLCPLNKTHRWVRGQQSCGCVVWRAGRTGVFGSVLLCPMSLLMLLWAQSEVPLKPHWRLSSFPCLFPPEGEVGVGGDGQAGLNLRTGFCGSKTQGAWLWEPSLPASSSSLEIRGQPDWIQEEGLSGDFYGWGRAIIPCPPPCSFGTTICKSPSHSQTSKQNVPRARTQWPSRIGRSVTLGHRRHTSFLSHSRCLWTSRWEGTLKFTIFSPESTEGHKSTQSSSLAQTKL